MSQSDRSRKLFVRSVLAGTTTLATLMGAQSLAMIDSQPVEIIPEEELVVELTPLPTLASLPTAVPTQVSLENNNLKLEEPTEQPILHVEPSITIFRQPGSVNTNNTANVEIQINTTRNIAEPDTTVAQNTMVIQPPQPVELAAPEPIIIVEEPVAPPPVIVQPPQQSQPRPQAQNNNNKPRSRSSR